MPHFSQVKLIRYFILHDIGFLFLIMERMESDMVSRVEEMAVNCDLSLIPIGPLAERMVDLVQAIHNVNQLVIDVKPENFMFASASSKTRGKNDVMSVEQLRMVDFGLMHAFKRPEEIGELHGTAMYASLHMHTLHNSSRRDDVEMVLYVLGEILIRVRSIADGKKQTYEKTSIPSYLPWSQAQSDDELYNIKLKQVKDLTSEFYCRMPLDAARILFHCLELVWSYNFNTEPDYDDLKKKLRSLSVPNTKAKGKKPTRTAKPTRRTASAATASKQDNDDEENDDNEVLVVSPPQTRATRSGRVTRNSSTKSTPVATKKSSNQSKKDHGQSGNGGSDPPMKRQRLTRPRPTSPMEVVEVFPGSPESDANGDTENQNVNIPKTSKELGLKFVIQSPGKSGVVDYKMAVDEALYVGKKPSAEVLETNTWIEIPGSSSCRITPKIQRERVLHVVVKDLNPGGESVHVGRKGLTRKTEVPKGGEAICMIPGQIYVGSHVMQVQRL